MTEASAPVSARTLGDQLLAALISLSAINVFDGRVTIPPYSTADPTTHKFWDLDVSGQPYGVHAYAVLYMTPGRRSRGRLGSTADRFDGTFQITCAGADRETCLWCVDAVTTKITGLGVLVPGRTKPRRVVEDESNGSRTVLLDEDVAPARAYVPLLFNIRA